MMNQEDLFKKVGAILNELNEQYQYLAQNPQQLNELELELFLANGNFLTEHIQIIRKINYSTITKALPEPVRNSMPPTPETTSILLDSREVDEETAQPAIIGDVEEGEAPEFQKEVFKIDSEPSTFEFILSDKPNDNTLDLLEKDVYEIFDRRLSKEEEEVLAEKQRIATIDDFQIEDEYQVDNDDELTTENELEEEEEVGPEPFLVEKEEEQAIIPAFDFIEDNVEKQVPGKSLENLEDTGRLNSAPSTVKPTLNDLLAGKQSGIVPKPSESSKPAIKDLKQAINLNDKLLYIKDLFNGYNLAYAEAIELVNKMPDFKTADNFLKNNYAIKNNWAGKQNTVGKFYDLLHQRFHQ